MRSILLSSSSILGCHSRVSFICASGSIFLFVLWCENPSCFASLFILALSVLCGIVYPCDLSTHYLPPLCLCLCFSAAFLLSMLLFGLVLLWCIFMLARALMRVLCWVLSRASFLTFGHFQKWFQSSWLLPHEVHRIVLVVVVIPFRFMLVHGSV